jgi:membrane protein CcdC involved in cytochrome C biogenesis
MWWHWQKKLLVIENTKGIPHLQTSLRPQIYFNINFNIIFPPTCMSVNRLMFCKPCIIAYQYSETKVMHFLFSLLRIKGLYMFRALLAHPQEALHKRYLVYCVLVMSVGCARIGVEPNAVSSAPPEDKQVMLETLRGP